MLTKKIYKINGLGTYSTESGFKNAVGKLHKSIPWTYEIYELTSTGDVCDILEDIENEKDANRRNHKINVVLGNADEFFLNFEKIETIFNNLSKLNFNTIYYPNGEILHSDYYYKRHIQFIQMDLSDLGFDKKKIKKYITNNFIRLLEYTIIPDYNNLDMISEVYSNREPNNMTIELCTLLFKIVPNFKLNSKSGHSFSTLDIFQKDVYKKVIRCIQEFKNKKS